METCFVRGICRDAGCMTSAVCSDMRLYLLDTHHYPRIPTREPRRESDVCGLRSLSTSSVPRGRSHRGEAAAAAAATQRRVVGVDILCGETRMNDRHTTVSVSGVWHPRIATLASIGACLVVPSRLPSCQCKCEEGVGKSRQARQVGRQAGSCVEAAEPAPHARGRR